VSWPWRSPEATRQALTAKIRARHPQELRGQRLREIAYRRLPARIFATQPEPMGGQGRRGATAAARPKPDL
jgi:hypothetical protein